MADFTRKAIKETFIELLEEYPISEITVKRIVETCGVNRNSFYYHFQDLPALVEEITQEEADAILKKYPSINSTLECYDALVEFTSHRKKAIMHIYHSLNREIFEQKLMWVSETFVEKYIDQVAKEVEISERDREALVNYYKCLGFGLIIDWLNHGMSEEYASEIRRIAIIRKDFALDVVKNLKTE